MRILNLYFSSTGNTAKVAETITDTVSHLGYGIDTMKISADLEIDILDYDLVFAGSGIYEWLPGKPVVDLFIKLRRKYVDAGEIKASSPRRPGKWAVIYCTYGGAHTGINEAIPGLKYMGQLFDHLGYVIIAEWAVVGSYKPRRLSDFSVSGRLGDIRERPDEHDLKEVAERVKGIISCVG
ncbi:flavodoxin family protein [Thermodesulforhabdus norvegica]|uniref:Flavodoxin domain-containing protein n=1 Tax=Thermodesulforhabdus norvegica TaxID=39841 RepID=A0A1I4QWP7_9BACT|nr:flavodoxin domain-containing protein [Thermodesulforhabdus norvegica]SFM44488.1 Flavodoxin domain-containing protein [Thermodesulforhabdus norvegica]